MVTESEKKRCEKLIALRDAEYAKQSNFRNLWQDTADWILPMFGRIQDQVVAGERFGQTLYDVTARVEARLMASGLSSEIIPPGQEFFDFKSADRDNRDDGLVQEYLAQLTEDVHAILFDSNFIEEFNGAVLSLIVFGTCDIFPRWTATEGLRFITYPIGSYQIRENSSGIIDTKILTVKRTARQLFDRYGKAIGEKVRKALESNASGDDGPDSIFQVIQIVQPRKVFTPKLLFGSANNRNMPFESVHICEIDRNILEEGGFPYFPFAIARWLKSPGETYGRGQGTEILPQVRKLNQIEADHTQAGNRWVQPPLEVLESFEGNVNLSPKAQNFVVERDSIRAIDLGAKGAYPISDDALRAQRELVREGGFFHSAFAPLTDLKGDRRNELEIRGRLREAYKVLSQPLMRIFNDLLDPLVSRATRLLIEHGVVDEPPPQLDAVNIEYTGPAALALRDQHVLAFAQWIELGAQLEELQEGTIDNIDVDEAYRDIGRFLGVKESHLRALAQRNQIREQRQKIQEIQMQLQAAQAVGQAYGQTQKAPEPGSAAESLREAI